MFVFMFKELGKSKPAGYLNIFGRNIRGEITFSISIHSMRRVESGSNSLKALKFNLKSQFTYTL